MMVERTASLEILGKYQFGDSIGHGAFGKVFRALNVQTGDFIAIKQIERAVIQPEHLPGILRECQLLRTLNHPNIVTFIDSHETDEYLYYIMEYVEGGSISKLVKKFGPFPESLLAHYISQVLKGLQYLHSQGVIHRDIKGENVLVTKQGSVKLVDFGSCTYQAMDKMLTVVGTPFWMAPEIIEMDGSARNTACDIWSLGCTIIELSTGFPPFWELGPMPAMFAMVNQEHPPLPPGASELMKEFLLLCFTKEIQKRPTAAQLLEHPWIAAAVKKTEKIDFNLNNSPNPEHVNREATMKQLQMENENLRSTVKSLKQHMLKMMKDQKSARARIESLEAELLATKTKSGNPPGAEGSPELRSRKTMPPSSLSYAALATNGTYLATGASASPTPVANVSSDRLFSPGKPRAASFTKPLPPTPPVANGPAKNPAKLGTPRLNIDSPTAVAHSVSALKGSASRAPSPRNDDDAAQTRLRSSSEPSPFLAEVTEKLASPVVLPVRTSALQTGSVSSPRNSPIRNRCGTCAGCMDDGLCHYRIANLTLSPTMQHNSPATMHRVGGADPSNLRSLTYLTHPASPNTPSRMLAGVSPTNTYATFAYQRSLNPSATASTPNLPLYYLQDPGGRVSPSSSSGSPSAPQIFSPDTSPSQQFSVSNFSPSSNQALKTGDKCRVRQSNTWHRAVVAEVMSTRKTAIVVYKATGKREEVLLENILTEEEGKRKKMEKEKGQNVNSKRKHVATIFSG